MAYDCNEFSSTYVAAFSVRALDEVVVVGRSGTDEVERAPMYGGMAFTIGTLRIICLDGAALVLSLLSTPEHFPFALDGAVVRAW